MTTDPSAPSREGAGGDEPVIVRFTVAVGDEWRDADGFTWRVESVDDLGAGVLLSRKVTTNVQPRTLVREWRMVDDPHD